MNELLGLYGYENLDLPKATRLLQRHRLSGASGVGIGSGGNTNNMGQQRERGRSLTPDLSSSRDNSNSNSKSPMQYKLAENLGRWKTWTHISIISYINYRCFV